MHLEFDNYFYRKIGSDELKSLNIPFHYFYVISPKLVLISHTQNFELDWSYSKTYRIWLSFNIWECPHPPATPTYVGIADPSCARSKPAYSNTIQQIY